MRISSKVRGRVRVEDADAEAVRRWMGEVMEACDETGLGQSVREDPREEPEE